MTDKKTRAPRQMEVDAIIKQLEFQPLENKIALLHKLKSLIDVEKQELQKKLELINGSGK